MNTTEIEIVPKIALDRKDVEFAGFYYLLFYRVGGQRGIYPIYTESQVKHAQKYIYEFLGAGKDTRIPRQILGFWYRLENTSFSSLKRFFDAKFRHWLKPIAKKRRKTEIQNRILRIRRNILESQGLNFETTNFYSKEVGMDNQQQQLTTEEEVFESEATVDIQPILDVETFEDFKSATGFRFRMTKEMKSRYGDDRESAFRDFMSLVRSDSVEGRTALAELMDKIRNRSSKS